MKLVKVSLLAASLVGPVCLASNSYSAQALCGRPSFREMEEEEEHLYACFGAGVSAVWGNENLQRLSPEFGLAVRFDLGEESYKVSLDGAWNVAWVKSRGVRTRAENSWEMEMSWRIFRFHGGEVPYFGFDSPVPFEVEFLSRVTFDERKDSEYVSLQAAGVWVYLWGLPEEKERFSAGVRATFTQAQSTKGLKLSGSEQAILYGLEAVKQIDRILLELLVGYESRFNIDVPAERGDFRSRVRFKMGVPVAEWIAIGPVFTYEHDERPPVEEARKDEYSIELVFQLATPIGS